MHIRMSVGLFSSVYMSGHNQWHSNGVWWISRLAVHWDCHRTVSGAWSDIHCQCGGKEQCWSKRDIQWHGDSIISGELIVSKYVAESITMIAGRFGHEGLCQLRTERS